MKKKQNLYQLPSSAVSLSLISMASQIENLKQGTNDSNQTLLRVLLKALDLKDHYTFGHSLRVAYFSTVTGKEYGFDNLELKELELAALFHDIGKIGTPDEVLNKPSRLSEDEFAIMKKHPSLTYELLQTLPNFNKISVLAKHHHERFDGRGYPDSLKAEQIPLSSRIILIADTFDAMTSSRPYRKGLSYEIAFDELKQFSGTQFDPHCVDAFVKGMEKEQKKNEKEFYLSILDEKFSKLAA